MFGFIRTARTVVLLALLTIASGAFAAKTYSDNGDGTVTDPTTGLTWMRCSMGQTWDGTTCTGTASTYTFDQANALTGTVTFAGHSDWRMPNIRELTTIVDVSVVGPAIDRQAFPATPNGIFWSGSPYAGDSGYAWYVHFSSGEPNDYDRSGSFAARLVRAGQSLPLLNVSRPDADYVNHGDGTVTHTPTGLTWKRCAEGQTWTGSTCTGDASIFTFDQANALTGSVAFAGKSDWRVPSMAELQSLVDYRKNSYPALNEAMFPATRSSVFWSDSPVAHSSYLAWFISFYKGYAYVSNRSGSFAVRLVRAGQSFVISGFSVELVPGWNLIGNSINAPLDAAATFGNANNVLTVWKWTRDVATQANESKWAFFTPNSGTITDNGAAYAASKEYVPLTSIGAGEGFWVNAKAAFTAQLPEGTSVLSSNFQDQVTPPNKLPAGWSLIAVGDSPSPRAFANGIALSPPSAGTLAATSLTTLWAWYPGNGLDQPGWYFYAPSLDNSDGLASYNSGKGYFDFGATTLTPTTGFWVNKQ